MKFITILVASGIFMLPMPAALAETESTLELRPPPGERFGPPTRSNATAQSANRIDIRQGGGVCYSNQTALELWRPNADTAVLVSIQDLDSDNPVRLSWPAQQHTLAWPVDKIPITANRDYILQYGDMPVAVSLYPIPDELVDANARQAWMQEKGCFW